MLAVQVTPCSDAGGPDNLYHVETGSVYLPVDLARRKAALDCIGSDPGTAARWEVVEAFRAYAGLERDEEHVVRIGPVDPDWVDRHRDGWNPPPDTVLRAHAGLERYVRRQFLRRA